MDDVLTVIAEGRVGAWSREALEASFDRDAERRLQRPYTPSTSTSPRRCVCCQQWGVGPEFCRECGEPWTPVPLAGLEPVRVKP